MLRPYTDAQNSRLPKNRIDWYDKEEVIKIAKKMELECEDDAAGKYLVVAVETLEDVVLYTIVLAKNQEAVDVLLKNGGVVVYGGYEELIAI